MIERPIFFDGDPWRDLTPDVLSAGSATVVTLRGTAILLDADRPDPRYRRVPLEGGHQMPLFDGAWLPLIPEAVTLTPCGLVVDHPQFWYRSTRVRLVVAGAHPRWVVDTPYGVEVLDRILAGRQPDSPGHGAEPCAAFYCTQKGAGSQGSENWR